MAKKKTAYYLGFNAFQDIFLIFHFFASLIIPASTHIPLVAILDPSRLNDLGISEEEHSRFLISLVAKAKINDTSRRV